MKQKLAQSKKLTTRSGAALLLSLTAVLIAAAVSISLTRTFLLQSRHAVLRLDKDQADLLALAGLDQAAGFFQSHPEQMGFEWDVMLPGHERRGRVQGRLISTTSQRRELVVTATVTSQANGSTQSTLVRQLTSAETSEGLR